MPATRRSVQVQADEEENEADERSCLVISVDDDGHVEDEEHVEDDVGGEKEEEEGEVEDKEATGEEEATEVEPVEEEQPRLQSQISPASPGEEPADSIHEGHCREPETLPLPEEDTTTTTTTLVTGGRNRKKKKKKKPTILVKMQPHKRRQPQQQQTKRQRKKQKGRRPVQKRSDLEVSINRLGADVFEKHVPSHVNGMRLTDVLRLEKKDTFCLSCGESTHDTHQHGSYKRKPCPNDDGRTGCTFSFDRCIFYHQNERLPPDRSTESCCSYYMRVPGEKGGRDRVLVFGCQSTDHLFRGCP